MIAAIVLAVGVMMFLAGAINDFVEKHPTIKILALSFLLLVGLSLIGEGFRLHIPKGYIYFAMAFSIFVELINMRIRPPACPVELRRRRPLSTVCRHEEARKNMTGVHQNDVHESSSDNV